MDPETLAVGGEQAQYFRTPEFSKIMLECTDMLKVVLDAPGDARMIFLTASGTAAMEASVMNLFTRDDKVLVVSGGSFGRRFKEICTVHRVPVESIDLRWDEPFDPEMLNQYENSNFTGMLVNMCETSTGQLYPMEIISDFCRRNNICLVVDAISSFLCDPFSMKKSGADAVIVSSQKGLALNPGMSFVAVTKEAFENRCLKNPPQSLYFSFIEHYRDIQRGQTPFTPAVGIINQLHEKLRRVTAEGVAVSIAYIAGIAKYFREQLLVETKFTYSKYPLSNCLTPVFCPENNAKYIFETLKDKHDVYITPCAGEIAQLLFRVAHMSRQLTRADMAALIELLKIL
jgi:aspartate aminotransferase-like enzyme